MRRNVYINGRFLSQEATGVQRYAQELVKTLDSMIDSGEINPGNQSWMLMAPRKIRHTLELKHIGLRQIGWLSGQLWEQIELSWHTRKGILVNLCNTAPLIRRNQIVTIHDAGVQAVPESYAVSFRFWYRFLLFVLGRRVRQVLTVSNFSRDELTRYIGIAPSKIQAIHHGSEHIAAASAEDYIIDRARLRDRPYLLAVSSLSPRKNFQALLEAVDMLGKVDFDVVIAGGLNARVFGENHIVAHDRVRLLGYVNDGELKSLYRHAGAFIYPSLYEGFGLPPLEAMTCGCPVIVSDIPVHREVCGEAALYCNPRSIEDIAAKIRLIMADDELRRKLIANGYERAREFSWRRAAGQFFAVTENLTLS
jgi:glycosyltransferase involved in cell wall biosynthesis